MPRIPEQHGKASRFSKVAIQRTAKSHADEILSRLDAARKSRAKVFAAQTQKLTKLQSSKRGASIVAGAAKSRAGEKGSAGNRLLSTSFEAAVSSVQTAGYLLAVGDSWFDYPIHDVLTKLEDTYGYNIESAAHKGDPIEAMVSRAGQMNKFGRCLDKVLGLGDTPKAVLVSGGGDDIAGAEFGMLINNIDLPIAGWNDQVLAGVIDTRIDAAYRLMFSTINALCVARLGHAIPILIHGYDHPVPDGRGFLGGWGALPGPWLKPGFDEKLFTDIAKTTSMMVTVIDHFNDMLKKLVAEFPNVVYVDLRGTLSNGSDYKKWWANELHPTGGGLLGNDKPDGFGALAAKFQAALTALP